MLKVIAQGFQHMVPCVETADNRIQHLVPCVETYKLKYQHIVTDVKIYDERN